MKVIIRSGPTIEGMLHYNKLIARKKSDILIIHASYDDARNGINRMNL